MSRTTPDELHAAANDFRDLAEFGRQLMAGEKVTFESVRAEQARPDPPEQFLRDMGLFGSKLR